MRTWKNNIDNLGQLVQETGNDLDTAQRMGMYYAGLALRKRFGLDVTLVDNVIGPDEWLYIAESHIKGDYMRTGNPDSRGYYPDMMTRDQQTGVLAVMLSIRVSKTARKRCLRLMWNNLKRFWFTNNKTGWRVDRAKEPEKIGKDWPNFAGLSQLAMCFRVLKWWPLYPLICILDLELIWAAVEDRFFKKQGEPINSIMRAGIAASYYPTPASYIAGKINRAEDMFLRIERYMERGPHKAPPLQQIWSFDLLKKFISS